MNKFLSFFSDYSPLLFLFICFVLIVTPIPSVGIEVIVIIYTLASLGIVIWKKLKKQFSMNFPKIIKYFCMIFIGIAIATTRTFLTEGAYENQIFIIRFIGEFICRENELYGFISIICFGGLICYVIYGVSKHSWSQNYSKANDLICKINGALIKEEIEQNQADLMKNRINALEDYYQSVSLSLDLFGDIYKALVIIFIVDVIGGTLIGVFLRGEFWLDSASQYISLFSGFFLLMCIPLGLLGISFKINEKKYLTSIL